MDADWRVGKEGRQRFLRAGIEYPFGFEALLQLLESKLQARPAPSADFLGRKSMSPRC